MINEAVYNAFNEGVGSVESIDSSLWKLGAKPPMGPARALPIFIVWTPCLAIMKRVLH